MEIKLNKNISLSGNQEEYITRKIDHLKKLAKRGDDESSKAYIDIDYVQHKDPSEKIGIKINLVTPGKSFHAEDFGTTVEEVVDKLEAKLMNQIEHSKK
jgi:ribosome-associated translation inhibitor RaiA